MTEAEYHTKLIRFEMLFDQYLPDDHPDFAEFMALLDEIEAYEEKHFKID